MGKGREDVLCKHQAAGDRCPWKGRKYRAGAGIELVVNQRSPMG